MWRRARIPYQKALMAHESTTYGGNQSKGGKAKAIVNTPVKTSMQVGVEMKSRVAEVSTYNGRVWITWKLDYFQVVLISRIALAVTCQDERRSLWEYVDELSVGVNMPWIVTRDFNSVLKLDNRAGKPDTHGGLDMEKIE
ncbi:hypothetical protein KY290_027264 [Solanum tuberosum]|uniref:Endonuclease/exonuclease/phosphatase n=1 Tax=Solanum tuberosum TaxID=4113 RepID=A0ABQ7UEM9_SOLTU|nr:hypothetical protein KY290_027264 [Solanum tuberosum]